MSSTLYTISALIIAGFIGCNIFYMTSFSRPVKNNLYSSSKNVIMIYSIGASLLLYGMALYFFSSFPQNAPRILLLTNIVLILLAWITLFANSWKEQARLYGASGLNPSSPSFIGIASAIGAILLFAIYSLTTFRDMTNQLSILIAMTTLLLPSFFLSTYSANSFILNEFTGSF